MAMIAVAIIAVMLVTGQAGSFPMDIG